MGRSGSAYPYFQNELHGSSPKKALVPQNSDLRALLLCVVLNFVQFVLKLIKKLGYHFLPVPGRGV
jgi:hypothetical protein